MGTYIIITILVIIVALALVNTKKHLKGEGGCCGGGSAPKVKKQKLDRIVAEKRLYIEGMKCENCSSKIENHLNEMNQVNAKVSLKHKYADVRLGAEVSDEELTQTVGRLGYQVVRIENK